MKKHLITMCSCALLAGVATLGSVLEQHDDDDGDGAAAITAADRALVTHLGSFSGVEEQRFSRADSELVWRAMWQDHAGDDREKDAIGADLFPIVDFDRCTVVGVFGGEGWNSRGYEIESIDADDERVRIRIVLRTFQTAGPDGGGIRTTPYGIFILPKTTLPIVIEEDTRNLKDAPPQWAQRAILKYEPVEW